MGAPETHNKKKDHWNPSENVVNGSSKWPVAGTEVLLSFVVLYLIINFAILILDI